MSRWRDVLRGGFGRGIFPHQLWFLLEIPGRRFVQPPAQLAHRLRLSTSSRVLEIGPGSGFFSVALAKCVPDGHLALLDLQPAFLARVERKLSNAGFRHFSCTAGNACDLPFPDGRFDAVVLVTVLGEITNRPRCLDEVLRVLRRRGLLSITELGIDPDCVPRKELDLLATGAGFEFVEAWGTPRRYTAHFRRPQD